MKVAEFVKNFLVVFIIAFVVSSVVTFLYSLIVHSEGAFNWSIAFQFSITLGIIVPLLQIQNLKSKNIN